MDEKQMTRLKKEIQDANAKLKQLIQEEKKTRAELYPDSIVEVEIYETTREISNIRDKMSRLKGVEIDFPAGPSRNLKRAEEEVKQARTEVNNLQQKIEDITKVDQSEYEPKISQQNLPVVIQEEKAFMKFIKRIPFIRRLMKSKILDKELKGREREDDSELTKLKQDLEKANIVLQEKEEKYNDAHTRNQEHQEKQQVRAKRIAPEIHKLEEQLDELVKKETDLRKQKHKLETSRTKLTQDEIGQRKKRLEEIKSEKAKLFNIIDKNDAKIKAENPNFVTRKDIENFALSHFGLNKAIQNNRTTEISKNSQEIGDN